MEMKSTSTRFRRPPRKKCVNLRMLRILWHRKSDHVSLARPIELDSGGKIKAGGAGKLAGSWNYTPTECNDVAWAALVASEIGITDMDGLHGRVRDFYLPKALEIARTGGWTNALSHASKKEKKHRR